MEVEEGRGGMLGEMAIFMAVPAQHRLAGWLQGTPTAKVLALRPVCPCAWMEDNVMCPG